MAFASDSIDEFLESVSSSSPTPGGGSVAAVTGALAASLVEMVANLTIGKKGYEGVWKEMERVAKTAKEARKKLLSQADIDAKAFEKVMAAYKVSKDDTERKDKIQTAFKNAAEVPAETAKISSEVLTLAKEVEVKGNKNAVSDAKVAQHLAKAAIASAIENIKINMDFIEDKSWKEELEKVVASLGKL